MMKSYEIVQAFFLFAAMAAGILLAGCDNKETVLDIQTPDGQLEVERDRDNGAIDIQVED